VSRYLLDWIISAGDDGPYGDAALLRAMVSFEVALVRGQAELGIVPDAAADAIARHAPALSLDPAQLARAGAHAGTVVVPFVPPWSRHRFARRAAHKNSIAAPPPGTMDTASCCAR
jgi:hypothetical protein